LGGIADWSCGRASDEVGAVGVGDKCDDLNCVTQYSGVGPDRCVAAAFCDREYAAFGLGGDGGIPVVDGGGDFYSGSIVGPCLYGESTLSRGRDEFDGVEAD